MAQLLNTTITGTLGATGAVAFGATLAVTGAVTFGSTLGVTGAIMGGSLAVAGALTGASLTVTGAAAAASLAVTGAATAATVVASGAVTGASFNGVTLTAGTNTFTITVGTASIVVAAGMGGTLGSNAFTSTAYVPQTRTVAGHTLSGNITIAASDLSNGTTGSGQIVLKSYVDGLVTSPINLKGGIDATANPNYPAATIGDSYRVTVAGRIGGASGKVVSVGDMVVCFTTSITGSEAAVGANWNVSEANIPGITGTGSALITAADAAAARAAISAETAGAAAAVEETLKTYAWKARVRIVVTTNVSLNGDLNAGNVWDSVSLAQGDRLLLVGQNTATENGIYIAPLSGTASRAADFDAWSAILGAIVPVEQGSVYAGTAWRCTNGTGGTIGSSSVVFAQMREGDSRSYVPVADGGSLYPLAGSHWEAVSATASFYVYLPFSPSLGTEVFFRDAGADFSTHSVTLAGQSG